MAKLSDLKAGRYRVRNPIPGPTYSRYLMIQWMRVWPLHPFFLLMDLLLTYSPRQAAQPIAGVCAHEIVCYNSLL